MIDSGTLVVRTLSYWRRYYCPTYIGTRLLLDTPKKQQDLLWLNKYLERKLFIQSKPKYVGFKQFKGIDKNTGITTYRDFIGLSPSTALLENWVLSILSSDRAFKNGESVYSYRLTHNKSRANTFEYFIYGYRDRIKKISSILSKNNKLKVLIYDIKNYYPSIDKKHVLNEFRNKMGRADISNPYRTSICDFVEQIIQITKDGIPIGPAMSCLLGNLALLEFDSIMEQKHGNNYFRYVDDLIVLCPDKEVDGTKTQIEKLLDERGYKTNDAKHEIVSSEKWLYYHPQKSQEYVFNEFYELLQRIRLFVYYRPDIFSELKNIFIEKGFSLPFTRLVVESHDGRYHRLWKVLFRGWEVRNESINSLLTFAKQVKMNTLKRIDLSLTNIEKAKGFERKTIVQRLRFDLNKSLYLLSRSEYRSILDKIPKITEFIEIRAVIYSIINEDIMDLLRMPGPAISTFCSLWSEGKFGNLKIDWQQIKLTNETLDSIIVMSLYGLCDIPDMLMQKVNSFDENSILNFCKNGKETKRLYSDLSYIDELQTLRINKSKKELVSLNLTRFSDKEELSLEALGLSGNSPS